MRNGAGWGSRPLHYQQTTPIAFLWPLMLFVLLLTGCSSPTDLTHLSSTIAPTFTSTPDRGAAATLTPSLIPQPTPATASFDGDRAYAHVLAQCDIGPRPTGSEGSRRTRDFITGILEEAGWDVSVESFEHRGLAVHNLLARPAGEPSHRAPILLGAHYDTRPIADHDTERPDEPILGANDGASGVAVLLELARVLDRSRVDGPVMLAFFDAEDRGDIDGWSWSVGAEHTAGRLSPAPRAVVIVDMVGDADQQLYWEGFSDHELREEIWSTAARLGVETFIAEERWRLLDDHLPFIRRGVPAALIIDFDYPYWHTHGDTPDKVSPESLERVGRVLQAWLEGD